MKPEKDPDLFASTLPLLSWAPESVEANLAELYRWAERFATDAIDWYMSEKRRKAGRSRKLRATAIIFATAGGLTPVAVLAAGRAELGNWGFVLLGLAAGCVAYDRFFGYSAAWLRYVSTATELRSRLAEFQLTWTAELAALAGQPVSAADAARLVGTVREFAQSVHRAIESETSNWVGEFDSRTAELESQVRQAHRPPAG